MARALALANAGATLASPNPTVGCALIRDGEVVGEGFHRYEQRDHAEIVALEAAGDKARGATAYVTLEPCSHHGRTPPCADALIAAGVARVVVATRDPNPLVSGSGLRKLRDDGVEVTEDVLREPARQRNNAFAKFITTGLPFVTQKIAVSRDLKIAPARGSLERGQRVRLTSDEANAYVQDMRAESDAVLTGAGTVLADDPLLTDRSGRNRRRPLLRVVLDSELRTPLDSKLVQSAQDDVLIFHACDDPSLIGAMEERGVRLQRVPRGEDALSLPAVLQSLAALQITSVLTEAGARLNTALFHFADALAMLTAPVEIGEDGMPWMFGEFLELPPPVETQLGPDRLAWRLLRDPWRSPAR